MAAKVKFVNPPAHWAEIVSSVKGFNERVHGVLHGMGKEQNGLSVASFLVRMWWVNEWDEDALRNGFHEKQTEAELLSFGHRLISLWDGEEPQTQGEVMVCKQIREWKRRRQLRGGVR